MISIIFSALYSQYGIFYHQHYEIFSTDIDKILNWLWWRQDLISTLLPSFINGLNVQTLTSCLYQRSMPDCRDIKRKQLLTRLHANTLTNTVSYQLNHVIFTFILNSSTLLVTLNIHKTNTYMRGMLQKLNSIGSRARASESINLRALCVIPKLL